MLPSKLKPEQFNHYPPQAGKLARSYLPTFQKLPLIFLPLLLRELITYDLQFPVEKDELREQLFYLKSLSPVQMSQLMGPFANLKLPHAFEEIDWINDPEAFNTKLSALLWTTSQIGKFTSASENYIKAYYTWKPRVALPRARLTMVAVGSGVLKNDYPLFRKLRRHGTYYTQVKTKNGVQLALDTLTVRAKAIPVPFGHWYISGGEAEDPSSPKVTCVAYGALSKARAALLEKMWQGTQSGGGPEAIHAKLLEMQPEDLGLSGAGNQAILNHFIVNILTQGSGTQIFSTSFVEWTAREAMRRAQPITMFVRFTPRRRSASLNEMLSGDGHNAEVDPQGSLIDADMGSYYLWLNQFRLPEADASSFLVWFEDHEIACCVSPAHKAATERNQTTDLAQLVRVASAS